MKKIYLFRCDALKKYMANDDIKSRCGDFRGEITIKEHSLEEFLDI